MDHKTDLVGRIVTALIEFHGQCFQIINVYRPNNHRKTEIFFDNLWRFTYSNLESIVVGDFVYQTLRYISGEAMTVLETAVMQLHSFTYSQALEDF